MLLQVERVVLNALGKNTALAADICASRESLAIVFRTSRSTMANKEQCSPKHGKKNSRTRTRVGVAVLAAANASTTTFSASRSDFLDCEEAAGIFFVRPLTSTARSRRRVGRRFSVR